MDSKESTGENKQQKVETKVGSSKKTPKVNLKDKLAKKGTIDLAAASSKLPAIKKPVKVTLRSKSLKSEEEKKKKPKASDEKMTVATLSNLVETQKTEVNVRDNMAKTIVFSPKEDKTMVPKRYKNPSMIDTKPFALLYKQQERS